MQISPAVPLTHGFAAELAPRVAKADFAAGRNVSVEAFAAGNMALTYPVVLPGGPGSYSIQKPAGMPPKPEGFLSDVDFPALTLTRLDNVACVPGGVALTSRNVILSDVFPARWDLGHHHIKPMDGGAFELPAGVEVYKRLPGRYLYLDYQHFDHYGHFLLDVMSRLWAFDYARGLGIQGLKVLVRQSATSYCRAMFKSYGLRDDQIVELDGSVLCEELFLASKALQIQEYVTPVAGDIWQKVRDGVRRPSKDAERIYISRSRHPLRPLTNESQVEALFRARGFEIIHPQELNVTDQISLFSGAKLIAGTSGTNMFNIAFQNNLKASFILTSPLLMHYSEQFLNSSFNSKLLYYVGDLDECHEDYQAHNVNSPWKVRDLEEVAFSIDQWIEHSI